MSEKKSVYRIFSINPGSTSTKVAVFDNTKLVASKTDRYEKSELAKFSRILDQSEFRLNQIISWLDEQGIALESIDAFVGRGGILKPMESGVYEVNDTMLADLHVGRAAHHASALGGIFAYELGRKYSKPAYIVDPVVVDERPMIAKVSGIPGTERGCVFHALNQRSVAHHYAEEHGKKYEDCCLLVAHLGGGITVGAHKYGKIVDVNDGIDGEGPFSPERCGSIQVDKIVELCFSGKYSKSDVMAFASKSGGLSALLNTTDCIEVEKRIEGGDEYAKLVYEAMIYNVAKQIGAMAAVLEGKAEAIILTGGLAYSKMITEKLKSMVSFIAPVEVYPGENELLALAEGALRAIRGEEKVKVY